MKKLAKISGIFALPVTIISFILMLATDAFIMRLRGEDFPVSGTDAIFGRKSLGSLDPGTNGSPLAATERSPVFVAEVSRPGKKPRHRRRRYSG